VKLLIVVVNYESVMDSEENQPMGSTAGRSGAISTPINQGKKDEVLGACATETRGSLKKDILAVTMPGTRRRGRPRISWRDNIGDWTGMSMKEALSSVQDRDRWRRAVHNATKLRSEDG